MSEPRAGKGTLYLVPVALGGEDDAQLLPAATLGITRALRGFIVENARSARRFLKAIGHSGPMREIEMHVLDEHTSARDLDTLLAPLLAGADVGLMSEAGCPAVADPGAALVRLAHGAGIRVVPLAGPSSILLALMASGLDGQHIAFHGYLPTESSERARCLRELDARSRGETQIFIETPYRNAAMLQALQQWRAGD